jgi:hypothetical protein
MHTNKHIVYMCICWFYYVRWNDYVALAEIYIHYRGSLFYLTIFGSHFLSARSCIDIPHSFDRLHKRRSSRRKRQRKVVRQNMDPIHKYLLRTSQGTRCASIRNTNRRMPFREIMAVYCKCTLRYTASNARRPVHYHLPDSVIMSFLNSGEGQIENLNLNVEM